MRANGKSGRRTKLPRSVIVRAPGLLPMQYKPSELADDIGLPVSTLRDWLAAGAPHSRDEHNHMWVNGIEFAAWVEAERSTKPRGRRLADNEGYCLRCRRPVAVDNWTNTVPFGKLVRRSGVCSHCGGTVNRGGVA